MFESSRVYLPFLEAQRWSISLERSISYCNRRDSQEPGLSGLKVICSLQHNKTLWMPTPQAHAVPKV